MDMQINLEQAASNFQQLQPEEKEAFGQIGRASCRERV